MASRHPSALCHHIVWHRMRLSGLGPYPKVQGFVIGHFDRVVVVEVLSLLLGFAADDMGDAEDPGGSVSGG